MNPESAVIIVMIFVGSVLSHEGAHWAQAGFPKWDQRWIMAGDLFHGGIGVPESKGRPGIAMSLALSALAAVSFVAFPQLSYLTIPALFINLILGVSAGDWKSLGNSNSENLEDLNNHAAALVKIADLFSDSSAEDPGNIINQFLQGSPLDLGVGQSLTQMRSDNWTATLSDPRFPGILRKEITLRNTPILTPVKARALLERLLSEEMKGVEIEELTADVVIPITSEKDLLEAKADLERIPRAQSVTLLISPGLSLENIRKKINTWPRSSIISVHTYAEDLISEDRLILINLKDSLPTQLQNNLSNILFVLPEGLRINIDGIHPGSELAQLRILLERTLEQSPLIITAMTEISLQLTILILAGRQA